MSRGREQILDLKKHLNTAIVVKFMGGREVTGVLKGFDPLVNLVLFDAVEQLQGDEPTERELGVVVCRGTAVTLVCPKEGMAEISNPFASADE